MKKIYFAIAAAALIGLGTVAQAGEQAGEKARIPTFGEVLDASGIKIGGYIDTSYTYSTNKNTTFTDGTSNRVFDRETNSFNFNMAELSISKQPDEGFGGTVVFNFGSDADITAPTGTGANDQFDVQQAFVSYRADGAHLMLGKFATLIGAEVIESPDNLNFSRSILFGYAIPFTHTGARLHYDFNDMLTVTVGVNNGWDNLKDNNRQKTVEAAISITPSEMFSLSVQGMSGVEDGAPGQKGNRNLIDVVATINATDQLSFVINGDYGTQKKGAATGATAKWWGIAGYVNYLFTDQWRMAVRGEYFNDKNGFRSGTIQKWKEVTATLAYMPTEHVELRAEYRHDWSDKLSFTRLNAAPRKSHDTAGLEAIYKF
jgi:hypothetical protein